MWLQEGRYESPMATTTATLQPHPLERTRRNAPTSAGNFPGRRTMKLQRRTLSRVAPSIHGIFAARDPGTLGRKCQNSCPWRYDPVSRIGSGSRRKARKQLLGITAIDRVPQLFIQRPRVQRGIKLMAGWRKRKITAERDVRGIGER